MSTLVLRIPPESVLRSTYGFQAFRSDPPLEHSLGDAATPSHHGVPEAPPTCAICNEPGELVDVIDHGRVCWPCFDGLREDHA